MPVRQCQVGADRRALLRVQLPLQAVSQSTRHGVRHLLVRAARSVSLDQQHRDRRALPLFSPVDARLLRHLRIGGALRRTTLQGHLVSPGGCHQDGKRSDCNIFVAHSAPWHEITGELPRHDDYPPETGFPRLEEEPHRTRRRKAWCAAAACVAPSLITSPSRSRSCTTAIAHGVGGHVQRRTPPTDLPQWMASDSSVVKST